MIVVVLEFAFVHRACRDRVANEFQSAFLPWIRLEKVGIIVHDETSEFIDACLPFRGTDKEHLMLTRLKIFRKDSILALRTQPTELASINADPPPDSFALQVGLETGACEVRFDIGRSKSAAIYPIPHVPASEILDLRRIGGNLLQGSYRHANACKDERKERSA